MKTKNWISVDIRIVAASDAPFKKLLLQKRFRAELFHRLNVLGLLIPPLYQRRDYILPLANHILISFQRSYGHIPIRLSVEAEDLSVNYPLLGMVRELRNIMERLVVVYSKNENVFSIQLEFLDDKVDWSDARGPVEIGDRHPVPSAPL